MSVHPFFDSLSVISAQYPALEYVLYLALTLGLIKLTITALSFASVIADLFFLPKTNFAIYGSKSKDAWAVVTGATDGLGKEFATQLAKKGFNILLVSRNPTTLSTLSKEIAAKYNVKSTFFAIDFSLPDINGILSQLAEKVQGEKLNVSILINNVGKSHSIPTPFLETTTEELSDIIIINNLNTLKFTQAVIPFLSKTVNELHISKKALILNISSFSGLLPTPYLATYSGSKAFLQNWSASLAAELESSNIDVHAVLAYLITSKMSKIRKSSVTIPNPKSFVASTLNNFQKRCGAQERFATVTPYWSHALMHWGIESTVGVYSAVANKLNYSMHKSIRARALKKAARKSKSS